MSTYDDSNPPEVDAQFPPGSEPENRVDKVSTLCSYGMRPHVMTGLLRQLLIGHFSDPSNIEEPRVRKHIQNLGAWQPVDSGLNAGGILIESITRWLPQTADKRPAVLIKRNGWKWMRQGIGDLTGQNEYTGSVTYAGMWEGSHTLYCLSPNGAETEFLTTEVVKFLLHYSPLIRDQMNLHRFIVAEVGGIGEIQEVVQGYAVPVTVSYVAEEAWTLQPYVPRLKRIVFKASDLLSY
ncbi:hypothetical protein [Sphingorhabdus sp.]|uniref:hypothetical protein n=1 Tax=Sphingorhabdus sp. TaxID=1902408 RepID=UPI003341DC9B